MKEVNEENITFGEVKKKGIVNKKNIKKFVVGFAIFATAITASVSLPKIVEAYDDSVDHTEEICLITRLQSENAGINHQIEAMEKDYLDKGIENPIITYGDFKENQINKITYIPISPEKTTTPIGYKKIYDENGNTKYVFTEAKQVVEDGETHYFLPSGYVLGTKEFDVPIGYQKICDEDGNTKYVFTEAKQVVEDGKTHYFLPSGYVLGTKEFDVPIGYQKICDEDGIIKYVVVEAKQIVKDGEIHYVVPSGFIFIKNSNFTTQKYATITDYVHEPYEGIGFCTKYMINHEDGSKEEVYDYLLTRKK